MWYLSQTHRFLNRFTLIGRFTPILIGYLKHESNSIKYQYMYFCLLVYKHIYNKDWEPPSIHSKAAGNILNALYIERITIFNSFFKEVHCTVNMQFQHIGTRSYCVHNTTYCSEFINYIYHLSSKALFKTLGQSQLPMCRT